MKEIRPIEQRIREGQEATEILRSLVPMKGEQTAVTKSLLVDHGRCFWPYTYKGAADDDEAEDHLHAYINELVEANPRRALILIESMKIPDQIIITFGACRWFDQGLPVIRLGHKRAAAFMATSLTPESMPLIIPPFQAFYIELPSDLICLRDYDGTEFGVTGVLVHVMRLSETTVTKDGLVLQPGNRWRYVIITNTHLVQWVLNRRIEELAGFLDSANNWEGMGLPLDDYDERVGSLIGKLICSTCLMMSNPLDLKERKETTSRIKTGKRATPGAPEYRVFTEGAPLSIDARPAITGYLRGERDTPRVRTLVRGHWKQQAHGPKHSLRKLLHIEPYWSKGFDGDPIMKRVYATTKETKSGTD